MQIPLLSSYILAGGVGTLVHALPRAGLMYSGGVNPRSLGGMRGLGEFVYKQASTFYDPMLAPLTLVILYATSPEAQNHNCETWLLSPLML